MTNIRNDPRNYPLQQGANLAKPLRTDSDLFTLFGVTNGETLARRLYQDTKCGVWIRFDPTHRIQTAGKMETWTATLRKTPLGPKVLCLTQMDTDTALFPRQALPYLREHLLLSGLQIIDMTWEELAALPENTDIQKVDIGDIDGTLTFHVEAPVFTHHRGGITLGAIVEGSKFDVQPITLVYPFTLTQLHEAINIIEIVADNLWQEAHPDQGKSVSPGLASFRSTTSW